MKKGLPMTYWENEVKIGFFYAFCKGLVKALAYIKFSESLFPFKFIANI